MATATNAIEHGTDAHDDAHHPSDWDYIKIAILLAVLTAVEVGMFVIEDQLSRFILFFGLTVLMVVKFYIVASRFMHLKFDTPLFSKIFVTGIVLAMGVYAIFFFSFDYFGLG